MKHKRHKKLPTGIFSTTIEKLSHEGRGIAHINGKTTFIDNALPGEQVDFEYTYTKSQFDEGKAIQIHQAAANRVEPRCPHFTICGGCSMQHLAQDAQIAHKQQTLLNQLQHFGQVQPNEILTPISSENYGYRTKARLGARLVHKKNSVLVGFREKYSNYLAEIDSCVILDERVGTKITALRELIASLSCPAEIAQIEVAMGEENVILIFRHLAPLTEQDHALLLAFANEHHFIIYLQPKGLDSIHVLPGQQTTWLNYHLKKYDLELLFHPTDFTQVNFAINQQMVEKALSLLELKPNDITLDLFCGLGNFTLAIARHCQKVIGVEGSNEMVMRAKMNAEHNNIHNTEFYAADLTQDVTQQTWIKTPFNKLLIDPPRSGAQEIIEKLPFAQIERIVYVSCNPATLARDTALLIKQGYRLEKAGILDMFPHTTHVESIALFKR